MKEYWEITHARGVATVPVWTMQPSFELRNLTLAQYTTNVNQMPALAQTRADKERAHTNARSAAADLFSRLRELNVRAPGAIHGLLEAHDGLHAQLDHIFAIGSNNGHESDLRRGRLVSGLWTDFNAQLAAQTPPKPAFTLKQNSASVTQAQFTQLLTDCLAAQQSDANAAKEVTNAKTALRASDSMVDRDSKRWYAAWLKTYPAGTPEGDAALADVPTEAGVPVPVALEIALAAPKADHTVELTYAAKGGTHATTLELQWKAEGDVDFGHSTPVARPAQTVGPFAAGMLVAFRTRVANSTTGVVLSAVRQVLVQ